MGRSTSVIDIEVLETLVSTQMEKYHDSNDFCITHPVWFVPLPAWVSAGKTFVCNVFIEKFAEIIGQTVNFSNFVIGEHSVNV